VQPNHTRCLARALVSSAFDHINYPFDYSRRFVRTNYEADDSVSQLRHAVSIVILAEVRISRNLRPEVEDMTRI
jgi:hypothetical protein